VGVNWCKFKIDVKEIRCEYVDGPIQVTARSKPWVCGHSLSVIAGSNPAGGMDVCLL